MRMRPPGTRNERAVKAVLAALVEGRMADQQADKPAPRSQVDRVLDGLGKAMLAGVVVLAVFALSQQAVLATLTLGLFAAAASAAAGAALGFLFALPSSAARVVVTPAPTPAPSPGAPPSEGMESAATAATAQAARDVEDWFRDNTALERLSDWLVGAIIALSLANFEAWRVGLQTLAIDVTRGMGLAGGEWGAPAGVIMAAYALLGFLGGYLWTRRYMLRELVRARVEANEAQQGALSAAQTVQRMDSPANVQNFPSAALSAAQVEAATHSALDAAHGAGAQDRMATEAAGRAAAVPDPWAQIVEPGPDPADPWAGQFGGLAAAGGFELAAIVRPVEGNPDLFGVDLTIIGRPGGRARLYLHPTFPEAIRELPLDATGRATQLLLAWGAFTVGVQFDTGQLRELNLATLTGAPERFRTR